MNGRPRTPQMQVPRPSEKKRDDARAHTGRTSSAPRGPFAMPPLCAPHCHRQTHAPILLPGRQRVRAIARWNDMVKKMLIDATHPEETRVVVVDGNRVEEFDFESENKRQIAGNIYLAKVTRVEPSLQAAFVDYGGNRHGFLAFSEIHPDYYQIPVADREKLLEEEAELARVEQAEEEQQEEARQQKPASRRRRRGKARAQAESAESAAVASKAPEETISGMDVIDLGEDKEAGQDASGEEASGEEAAALAGEEAAPSSATASDAAQAGEAEEEAPAAAGETGEAPGEVAGEGEGADAAAEAEEAAEEAQEADMPAAAAQEDADIEEVADEDIAEEVRPPRKRRPRKYKIQEVIKVRQILLVQVVKEERGNKGAALTTYLSLAGRYCVLMPNTARGGGISRKITNAADRKKLKAIAAEIDVPRGAGLIVRTAGARRTKSEIKRDYEYLLRLWEQIRDLTLKSIAPTKIYEEGDLIKRSIRDLYDREIDEVLVEGERGYRTAKDFMKMIMPSHAKKVKHYTEAMPLFARYQVEGYLAGMFNPTVQLKSGGYIVIGVTEALVAIDVNSGRATKEGSIEETALKTNLEAAEEVARQLRLRDLAGLIVIDFIDMEERRNNAAVEKRLKEKLKTDRARIQVGRISGFGLLEMSRQRLRPGMIEASTQPCPACHGTGLVRSDDSLALSILRQLEEEGTRGRSREVLVKAPVGIVNFLINQKREHIATIEARYGMAVRIEADPFLISPDFSIDRFRSATRPLVEADRPVVSGSSALMSEVDESTDAATAETVAGEEGDAPRPKKRRRRRRRRRSSAAGEAVPGREAQSGEESAEPGGESAEEAVQEPPEEGADQQPSGSEEAAGSEETAGSEEASGKKADQAARKPRRGRRKTRAAESQETQETQETSGSGAQDGEPAGEEAGAKTRSRKVSRKRKSAAGGKDGQAGAGEGSGEASPGEAGEEARNPEKPEKPEKSTRARRSSSRRNSGKKAEPAAKSGAPEAEPEPEPEAEPEPAGPAPEAAASEPAPASGPEPATSGPEAPAPEPSEAAPEAAEASPRPRKRGWWSLGR